jgi:hypothetical protein
MSTVTACTHVKHVCTSVTKPNRGYRLLIQPQLSNVSAVGYFSLNQFGETYRVYPNIFYGNAHFL